MAKEQDLSLNPQKISGVCGRLMCCLRYEFDAYKDFKSRAPKQNATVKTPDGPAKVVDLDVPREVVSVRLEGEKPVRVPLAKFDPPTEGARPNTIGKEAWEEATAPAEPEFSSTSLFTTDQFTGTDKLAEAGRVRRTGSSSKKSRKEAPEERTTGEGHARRRRRSTKVSADFEHASKQEGKNKGSAPKRKPRKRSDQKGQETRPSREESSGQKKKQPRQQGESGQQREQRPRPGQKSSGLRNGGQKQQKGNPDAKRRQRPQQEGKPASDGQQARPNEHRRARRRSHKAGGNGDGNGNAQSEA